MHFQLFVVRKELSFKIHTEEQSVKNKQQNVEEKNKVGDFPTKYQGILLSYMTM